MNKRTHRPTLESLGPQFSVIDQVLTDVLAKRASVSLKVGEFKLVGTYTNEDDRKTIRRDIERKRLDNIARYANDSGVDPNFARAILLLIIGESCKLQIEQAESGEVQKDVEWLEGNQEAWFWHLRQNLYELTAKVASSYEQTCYGPGASSAMKTYLDFEWSMIQHEIENLRPNNGLTRALDLGCATGHITRRLAESFHHVIGCDISPDMLRVAESHDTPGSIEYCRFDMEKGLNSIGSESINLVVMSLGTASDVSDLKRLLSAIRRVLTPHGRFVLTFYNQQALVYRGVLPWPLSMQAQANMHKKYLEVAVENKNYPVFAHFYTVSKVLQMLESEELHVSNEHILSYPTIASILPNAVLTQETVGNAVQPSLFESIITVDKKLADSKMGTYILASGRKKLD